MLSTHLKEMNNIKREIKIWNRIMYEIIIRRNEKKKKKLRTIHIINEYQDNLFMTNETSQ